MPFVKVANHPVLYLNTDHILAVYPEASGDDECAQVICIENRWFSVPSDAARYLLTQVETADALSERAEPASLKSKIAQALRDEFKDGILISHIHSYFGNPDSTDTTPLSISIHEAIGELLIERVITDDGHGYLYHASHAPRPSPDPSIATEGS